jgi:hypothetical protein
MHHFKTHILLSAGMVASVAAAIAFSSVPQIGHVIALTSNLVWLWEA